MKIAVYPGSFDPITYGHMDIAKRALKVFDKLIILISVNPNKSGLFDKNERVELVKHVMADYAEQIEVVISNDLTVKQTEALEATHIIRGLRAVTDFEYEFQMTHANRVLNQDIDSIFFMTDHKYSYLSSNTVKEIAQFNGDLHKFVPPYVEEKLQKKFQKNAEQ